MTSRKCFLFVLLLFGNKTVTRHAFLLQKKDLSPICLRKNCNNEFLNNFILTCRKASSSKSVICLRNIFPKNRPSGTFTND